MCKLKISYAVMSLIFITGSQPLHELYVFTQIYNHIQRLQEMLNLIKDELCKTLM